MLTDASLRIKTYVDVDSSKLDHVKYTKFLFNLALSKTDQLKYTIHKGENSSRYMHVVCPFNHCPLSLDWKSVVVTNIKNINQASIKHQSSAEIVQFFFLKTHTVTAGIYFEATPH